MCSTSWPLKFSEEASLVLISDSVTLVGMLLACSSLKSPEKSLMIWRRSRNENSEMGFRFWAKACGEVFKKRFLNIRNALVVGSDMFLVVEGIGV